MINKFYKTIHNKYSIYFRFIFFLRYLFGLFALAIILFLLIPTFFNYEQRVGVFKDYLIKNYDFKVLKYEKIKFNSFPIPFIELQNVSINQDSLPEELNVKKLKIYPKLLSIYNYKNFQTHKIILKESNIILETYNLKFFVKEIINQKNNLYFDNLNIKIYNDIKSLASLENIKFINYGYKKNIIVGNIFGKKFKTIINEDLNNINFKLPKSGLDIEIEIRKKNDNDSINGIFKSKILNTNLKFNFSYDENSLNIYNSFFRSKDLSFKNESFIIFEPFFESVSKFDIEDINVEMFKKLKIDKLLMSKNILKEINTKNEVNFNSKKFSRNFINKLNLKFNLAYGRLSYSKNLFISDNNFQCKGDLNLLEEFPLLFFDCSIYSNSKRDLLKKLNINIKKDNKVYTLNVKGNLSILNQKINFKEISTNENYKASNEDLNYFKEKFENILFKDNFIKIFNLKKIKKFILEIS